MNKTTAIVSTALALLLALTACNLPSSAPNPTDTAATVVAQTVQAQLTQAVPSIATVTPSPIPVLPTAVPPTLAPPPTVIVIPTATTICDIAQFITDVTIQDDTILTPGETFTKTWRFKNVGVCSWTPSYAIVFASGNSMNGPATQALAGNVNTGQTVDISVNLTAPTTPGDYKGNWNLRNAAGLLFKTFWVSIKVQAVTPPSATPTSTLPPAIVFAVTGVTYSVSTWSSGGNVNCPRITANITANGAGTVTYTWTSTSGTNSPQTLVFGSAGTQSINYDWARGSVWAGTDAGVGIYINAPNHQDFGMQHFTTACTTP